MARSFDYVTLRTEEVHGDPDRLELRYVWELVVGRDDVVVAQAVGLWDRPEIDDLAGALDGLNVEEHPSSGRFNYNVEQLHSGEGSVVKLIVAKGIQSITKRALFTWELVDAQGRPRAKCSDTPFSESEMTDWKAWFVSRLSVEVEERSLE